VIGFVTAPRIVFGPTAVEQLSALGADRPAVLVGPTLQHDARTLRVVEELAKRGVAVSTIVVPTGPATRASAELVAQGLTERTPDWIVALGGGTVLDLARAAWLRYERPELTWASIGPLTELHLRRKARFVAVPTTSGSGAEASPMLRLWEPDGSVLRPMSRELVPDWALIDPGWPSSQPPSVTADAAAEALANGLEALVSAWSNPMSDALARESSAQLLRTLPKLAKDLGDAELRAAIHHSATLAGVAAGNAGVGAASALSEALAPALGLSFGRCLGVLLPTIVEFNYPSARDAYQALGPRLGEGLSIAHRSDLPGRLRASLEALGVPPNFAKAGVSEDRWRTAAAAAVPRAGRNGAALSNPRVPSDSEWERLLDAAYRGSPVAF
jgi:alcohol dehydrogenase class IV